MFSFIVLDVHEVLLFFDKDQSIVGMSLLLALALWALWLSGSLGTLGSLGSEVFLDVGFVFCTRFGVSGNVVSKLR